MHSHGIRRTSYSWSWYCCKVVMDSRGQRRWCQHRRCKCHWLNIVCFDCHVLALRQWSSIRRGDVERLGCHGYWNNKPFMKLLSNNHAQINISETYENLQLSSTIMLHTCPFSSMLDKWADTTALVTNKYNTENELINKSNTNHKQVASLPTKP